MIIGPFFFIGRAGETPSGRSCCLWPAKKNGKIWSDRVWLMKKNGPN